MVFKLDNKEKINSQDPQIKLDIINLFSFVSDHIPRSIDNFNRGHFSTSLRELYILYLSTHAADHSRSQYYDIIKSCSLLSVKMCSRNTYTPKKTKTNSNNNKSNQNKQTEKADLKKIVKRKKNWYINVLLRIMKKKIPKMKVVIKLGRLKWRVGHQNVKYKTGIRLKKKQL